MARNLVLWIVIALVLMLVFQNFTPRHGAARPLDYSDFVAEVKSGRVAKVTMDGPSMEVELHDGSRLFTYSPESDNGPLIGTLLENSVRIEAQPPDRQGLLPLQPAPERHCCVLLLPIPGFCVHDSWHL